jgi:hypothetical protein
MPEKLMKFLCELAVDSKKLADYQKNPETAMQNAGLDDGERAALKSGDPLKVHAGLMGRAKGQKSGSPKPQPPPDFWGPQPKP